MLNVDIPTEIMQECILHTGKFNWQKLPDKYLEEFVREHCDDSSWRDVTVMIDHFSIDFIREFEDRFLWWNWPFSEHIKKVERYKEFWWKYD